MSDNAQNWQRADWAQVSTGFRDPRIGTVASHWASIRKGNHIPGRAALEPARMARSLEILWMIERLVTGEFRYRLAGDEISRTHGGIRRGSDPKKIFNATALEMFQRRWEFVLNEPCVMRAEGVVRLGNGRLVDVERLMLPLLEDKEACIVLGATNYMRTTRHHGTLTEFPPTEVRYVPVAEIPN